MVLTSMAWDRQGAAGTRAKSLPTPGFPVIPFSRAPPGGGAAAGLVASPGGLAHNVQMTVAAAGRLEQPALPLLSVSGLGVRFGPLTALDGVDLRVRTGELVALAGENGAGKTTLVRCIAGDIPPTSGVIALDGKPVPAGPPAARRRGVSVVWQDLALCNNLDIASNLLLGHERRRQLMSDTRFHADALRLLERLG